MQHVDLRDSPIQTAWIIAGEEVLGEYILTENGEPSATAVIDPGDLFHPSDRFKALSQIGAILHGVTTKGCPITLVDGALQRTSYRVGVTHKSLASRLVRSSLRPRYALEGAHLSMEQLHSTTYCVEFANQELWTGWRSWVPDFGDETQMFTSVKRSYMPSRTASIPKGRLLLEDVAECHISGGRPEVASTFTLISKSQFRFVFEEPVTIDDFIADYAYAIQVLLVSATGVNSGAINRLRIMIDDQLIEVRLANYEPACNMPEASIQLHHLSDFDFETQVGHIFTAAKQHRYALHFYELLLRYPSQSALANFTTTTQLIESMYTDRKEAGILRQKLPLLDEETNNFMTNALNDLEIRWMDELWEFRNVIIHRYHDQLLADASGLQAGTLILLLMFEVKLLQEYGFSHGKIEEIMTRSREDQLEAIRRGIYSFRNVIPTKKLDSIYKK